MASSADDLAAKVAEAMEEPLLVAIGAACSTPTETANKCQELGLTTEGEKLAKWVAVLKRDSQTIFGADFLSKLKEISDKKFPAEELKMKQAKSDEKITIAPEQNNIDVAEYRRLWNEYFVSFWYNIIKSKLARYEFEGIPVQSRGSLRKFHILYYHDQNFPGGKESGIQLCFRILVDGQGIGETYYSLLEIEGMILDISLVKKEEYKNAKLDILRVYAYAPVPLKKAQTLAKWLKTQKNLVKKVVVIKRF